MQSSLRIDPFLSSKMQKGGFPRLFAFDVISCAAAMAAHWKSPSNKAWFSCALRHGLMVIVGRQKSTSPPVGGLVGDKERLVQEQRTIKPQHISSWMPFASRPRARPRNLAGGRCPARVRKRRASLFAGQTTRIPGASLRYRLASSSYQ
jgi:hypothetical protein